jgi:arylsulfatase A-like enzyme
MGSPMRLASIGALIATWLCACAGAAENKEAARPNVVLIVSDDQGWGDYGFMGHPQIQTRHIDRLASESLLFTRGYVPTSLCRPSLASLVTGRYPHEHHIVGNDPRLPAELLAIPAGERSRNPLFAELKRQYSQNLDTVPTLPKLLVENGYLAHQSGKWWEQDYRTAGFTHGMTHGDATRTGRHGDEGLLIGRQTMQPVLEFIDEARKAERPFFVFYAPMLPHTPHNPPERLLQKYRERTRHLPVANYWAMCEWFDETVGTLLDAIEERGLVEKTIVIYVTDNGWTQPENEVPKAYGAPRGKRSPYDGGVRTPLMIRWPGRVAAARDEAQLASSLDILPTILHAAGIAPPGNLGGTNLLDHEAIEKRSTVFGEIYDHDATFPTVPKETLQYRWIVAGEWKLIVPEARVADGSIELFHITEDPSELQNLAGAPDQDRRIAGLRGKLNDWWTPVTTGR